MSVLKRTKREMPCTLALADGTIYSGLALGAERGIDQAVVGEVVFNTAMCGYQEILTDPSYAGQIITFTCPHIGNVGCNEEDNESRRVFVEGLIIRDQTRATSNFRAEKTLADYLEDAGVMGISRIDTRALVTHIRDQGAQMGAMACGEKINPKDLISLAKAQGSMAGKDYVKHVSCTESYSWTQLPWDINPEAPKDIDPNRMWTRPHVVAVDCGIKYNILRLLVGSGFRVTVVPATSSASNIMAHSPDGIFLSNGPGDPATLDYVVQPARELLGKVPMFGICLGHQILAQAIGAKTYKMKFGHRGGNHPVQDVKTTKVEITVQNHGFAVDADSVPKRAAISHINLNDRTVEGLDMPEFKAFSIQYHPEASPGPHDAQYHFNKFFELVTGK